MKRNIITICLLLCIFCILLGCVKQNTNNVVTNSNELTVEQSNEILETTDWLPLGTVVEVANSEQLVMIVGRVQHDYNNPDLYGQYTAVLYPQGLLDPKENYMFNLDQVTRIYFLGYSSDVNEYWEEKLNEYVKENNISFFDYEKMKEEQSNND